MHDMIDNKNVSILKEQNIRSNKEFACINISFQSHNKNEECEDAIVEEIAEKHQKTLED